MPVTFRRSVSMLLEPMPLPPGNSMLVALIVTAVTTPEKLASRPSRNPTVVVSVTVRAPPTHTSLVKVLKPVCVLRPETNRLRPTVKSVVTSSSPIVPTPVMRRLVPSISSKVISPVMSKSPWTVRSPPTVAAPLTAISVASITVAVVTPVISTSLRVVIPLMSS